MRIKLVSDLHLEFDNKYEFEEDALNKETVLILAGDICAKRAMRRAFIEDACELFKHVIMVAGNHDYYGSTIKATIDRLRKIDSENENFHFLEDDNITLDGVMFIGATLWSQVLRPRVFNNINDTYKIKVGDRRFNLNDMNLINYNSKGYIDYVLGENKDAKKVVITHFPPTMEFIAPRFKGDSLNEYFYNTGMDYIIPKADMWLWGHTHSFVDEMVENTRCVCNPLGYVPYNEFTGYKHDLILELQV